MLCNFGAHKHRLCARYANAAIDDLCDMTVKGLCKHHRMLKDAGYSVPVVIPTRCESVFGAREKVSSWVGGVYRDYYSTSSAFVNLQIPANSGQMRLVRFGSFLPDFQRAAGIEEAEGGVTGS